MLRDQNSSHDQSAPENINEDIADSHANGRQPWRESIGSSTPSITPRSRSFQQSIIFPSGDSPLVNEKVVEPEMLDHVPTRRQSHILYKGFISGVHAISPVIHPPTSSSSIIPSGTGMTTAAIRESPAQPHPSFHCCTRYGMVAQ